MLKTLKPQDKNLILFYTLAVYVSTLSFVFLGLFSIPWTLYALIKVDIVLFSPVGILVVYAFFIATLLSKAHNIISIPIVEIMELNHNIKCQNK